MPSHKAARYGSRAEKKVAQDYGLDLDGTHSSWKDAEFGNGRPVEIKACNRDLGYFQIYKRYHRILQRKGGYYAFCVYTPHGSGIRVLATKLKKSNDVPHSAWTNTNHDQRESMKARVRVSDVF